MSEKLKGLLEEFKANLSIETDLHTIQSKELKSIQKAMKSVAEEEWDKLSAEEQKEVSDIINDTESWWYHDAM